jgi:hypothetical protein
MKRTMLILFMASGLILGGCQIDTAPMDVEHFSTNRAATKDKAEYNGTYTLYGDDDAAVIGPKLMTADLKIGDEVGFEVGSDQQPYAIAGQQRLKLTSGRYRWEMTPAKGQTDWNRTNGLVVEIVVATAVIVIAVVSTLAATGAL